MRFDGRVRRPRTALWFGVILMGAAAPTRALAAEPPVRIAILIDTSKSMADRLPTVRDATSEFVRRLRMDDLAAIVGFDSQVEVATPFTGAVPELEQAIARLSTTSRGRSSVFNTTYLAVTELQKATASDPAMMRRPIIILLTDGEDTASVIPVEKVREFAKRSKVIIYTIGMTARSRTAGQWLEQLARGTGGAAFFPGRMSDLPRAYAQVWAALLKLNSFPVTTN